MSTKSNSVNRALAKTEDSPFLEVVAGSDKGKAYDISGDRLTIGRNDNNDIVVPSDSVSRYHAVLERTNAGEFIVRDNQSKNGVQVNGTAVGEATLRDGDVVQVGAFVFRFNDPANAKPAGESGVELAPVDEFSAAPVANVKVSRGPNKRMFIYGGLGLFLAVAWYMSNSPSSSTPASDDKTAASGTPGLPGTSSPNGTEVSKVGTLDQPKFENAPAESNLPGLKDPAQSRVEHETDNIDLNNTGVKEAEQYYRKGQREYLNKNYHRAIDNFQAALALNRGHELSEYYLRLAVYEVEAEAKKNFEIGIKYFESMQYSRAIYHFGETISLMQHRPTDKIIADAEKYIAQAKRRLQAAEQFP